MKGNLWIGVIACCFASTEAYAQVEEESGERYRMDEVTVSAEAMPDGGTLPDVDGAYIFSGKKATVINLQQRPAIANNNFRQAFTRTPGLLLSEETTSLFSAGTRGLSPNRAQFMEVLKDGVPIGAEMIGYPEAYYVPALQSVDHIEYVRGGAGLMYGPQPGGALNFITKDPAKETPLAAYTEILFGSHGLFSSYSSLSGEQGPVGYRGHFHERQTDGFRESNSDLQVIGTGLKTVLSQKEDSRLTFNVEQYNEEHGEPGGLTRAVAESEGRDATTRPNDRFRLERYYGTLQYAYAPADDATLEFRTFGGHYRRYSRRQRGGGFGSLPTGATQSTNTIEEQDFYTFGFEPRFRQSYDAFGQTGHAFTAGVLAYFADSPREDQRGASPDAESGALRNKSDRNTQYLSLFAEHLTRLGVVSVTPGVRLENIWQQLDEKVNLDKSAAGTPLADVSEFDFVPLFGIGATADIAKGVQLYSNLSQSYRPKVFSQAVPTGATTIVNGDLEEGKGWTLDAGGRGQPLPGLSWDASYFFMKFYDQVGASGNTIENVGDADHQGVELLLDADLVTLSDAVRKSNLADRIGSVGPYINLTLLDAKFTEGPQDGKTPQYAPQYTLKTGIAYRFRDIAKLSFDGTLVDDHFADDANLDNRIVPAYKVWDLTGEIRVWKDCVALVGGVNNVFDERYWSRITGDGIDPQDERNLYAGFRVGVSF